jgi:hypothetical protein
MLILLLGILVAGALWGYNLIVTGIKPVQPTPCVMVPMSELTPGSVVVRVYNGGSVRGRANNEAKALRELGYIVTSVGNTDEYINQPIIVGFSADSPEVQLLASRYIEPLIRADGRLDHTVDLLVGDAELPLAPEPLTALPVATGRVCIAPQAIPTPTPTPTDEAAAGEGGEGEGAVEGEGGAAEGEGGEPPG